MPPSDTGEFQFNLGQHEARLDAMERQLSSINGKLEVVVSYMERTKGSWKTIVAMVGVIGAIVEGAHHIVEWLHGVSHP